jgi:hypothetical protein
MLSTARSGATFVVIDPFRIGDSSRETDLRISEENLVIGSCPWWGSIFVEPRKCGGEAEEFVRVLLTTMSSSAEAKEDVLGANPGGKLLTGDDEAWDAVLTTLVEDGEWVEREQVVSSISIGSEAEKAKLVCGGGKSGIEPWGRARLEALIEEAASIDCEGPWMTAGASRSAVSIWVRRGADPLWAIVVAKEIIWDPGSMSCVSSRVSIWISG